MLTGTPAKISLSATTAVLGSAFVIALSGALPAAQQDAAHTLFGALGVPGAHHAPAAAASAASPDPSALCSDSPLTADDTQVLAAAAGSAASVPAFCAQLLGTPAVTADDLTTTVAPVPAAPAPVPAPATTAAVVVATEAAERPTETSAPVAAPSMTAISDDASPDVASPDDKKSGSDDGGSSGNGGSGKGGGDGGDKG